MAASLQFDCSDCHVNAGTANVDWAADTPRKITARRMVNMVTAINQTNFGGRQLVTCWTCHRNRDKPLVTPTMATIYGTPTVEPDDVITQFPGLDPPQSILDRYIQASGGAQRLAALTSISAKGTAVGFGGLGAAAALKSSRRLRTSGPRSFCSRQKQTEETRSGPMTAAPDGVRTPLNVVGEFQLVGSDLDGARVDAQLSFPGQIKTMLTNLKSGPPATITDLPAPASQASVLQGAVGNQSHVVDVVQGTGPRGLLVTLYFDQQNRPAPA